MMTLHLPEVPSATRPLRSLVEVRDDLRAALQEPAALLPDSAIRIRRMLADLDAEIAMRQRAA